ncbi:MAG: CDP-glucose 4,6-dehydratase [Puniceicoccaceae bacterium]
MSYMGADLLEQFRKTYSGKRVLITGHTGFKGSWLSEWLLECGAEVAGYALEPVTDPNLFERLGLAGRMRHAIADVRDPNTLSLALSDFKPDFVFHLAAQPLVVESYHDPQLTFETNIMGTVNLLEALRRMDHACIGIMVTSDKCYRNDNSGNAFVETDPLGGEDPYSASKGAMEIVVHSYRKSFFANSPVRLASARAGNVIGGGDYAADRIVPDCIRGLEAGTAIEVRNPAHTRPFQHVLEPLSGYLWLGSRLAGGWTDPEDLYAFNFGPEEEGHRSVKELVEAVLTHWPGQWESPSGEAGPTEAKLLSLSVERARRHLGWQPRWGFSKTVEETVNWYKTASGIPLENTDTVVALTRDSIRRFCSSDG